MFVRAALLQCAWCGDRPGFRRGWFHRHERCRHCGMSVQRGDQGFELGAASVNAVLTFAVLVAAGAISVAFTYPDVSLTPLVIVLGAAAILLPILFYPFTYTLWFAVELLVDPPSPTALREAEQHILAALPSGA